MEELDQLEARDSPDSLARPVILDYLDLAVGLEQQELPDSLDLLDRPDKLELRE